MQYYIAKIILFLYRLFKEYMAKQKKVNLSKRTSLRSHRQVISLNDEENKALTRYLIKYKVENKSKFIRETLMFAILRKFEEDHPTLFD
jgi:hypothetical protein